MKELTDKLFYERKLTKDEWVKLLKNPSPEYAAKHAGKLCMRAYGNKVFVRALIELTSFCKNDCFYCGIRRSNRCAQRYRLDDKTVLLCCESAYSCGMRTFVLQGGEDEYFSQSHVCALIAEIKTRFPDCAVTLSLGEKSKEEYAAYRRSGADRYLLRHESANEAHYKQLHPSEMRLERRKQCLFELKELGYAVGSGFMVGVPFQTCETLAEDMLFLEKLSPDMIGIGPFIPAGNTPFETFKSGSGAFTMYLISLLRIAFPLALIPSTTALGVMGGRIGGIRAGANVIMPNFTPVEYREKYSIYENKARSGENAEDAIGRLREEMRAISREVVIDRGDKRRCI
ncbi:MAG: [FeFe] hydrogenase H-cluster radical SAM maturase HydE [Clostridia bacterium]|nr:[FeFe] hydrogenase H-cluster radical SAM maturase HydE [Clostridia bacterium]